MTLFFNRETGRTITSDETKARFGTEEAIPQLGIYPLTYQPDFTPFAFTSLSNGTYLPVECDMQEQIRSLIEEGYTETEATALLTE